MWKILLRPMPLRVAFLVLASAPLAEPVRAQQKWDNLPRMKLDRQFAGPLRDTIIQRWSDPADGTVCYIYLPISAPHTKPTSEGFVQYGAGTIGTISCMPAQPPRPAAKR
jgi:hypothetical protein